MIRISLTRLLQCLLALSVAFNLAAYADDQAGKVEKGEASYYADSLHGNPTASGEPYDRNALTAAHRTLPFGTEVVVRNLVNGKSVRVLINDRGPFVAGRIVDLSYRAAELLDFLREGVVEVRLEIVRVGG